MRLPRPRNSLAIAISLAVFLASVEADELVFPDSGGCGPDDEPGLPATERIYTGRRITLDFKDADIVNVLRMLSEIGGENIVITDDVRGRMTVRLVDVPWDQALDIVLQMNRLQCVKIGNVRGVSTITHLKEEREAQLAAHHAAEELGPLKTAYGPTNPLPIGHLRAGVGAR
jgi:type IV pilus assembly protein PilQ